MATPEEFMERSLLAEMDNFRNAQTTGVPTEYQRGGTHHQNVHKIKLESDFPTWNNGAWFVLKTRFFFEIRFNFKISYLNAIIGKILGLVEAPRIQDGILKKVSIDNTQNNRVFETFIMIKRLDERLLQADPARAKMSGGYQGLPFHADFSPYEKKLLGDIWPMVKDPSLWQKSQTPRYESIREVLDALKNVIAGIAIHSTYEAIALEIVHQGTEPQNGFGSYDLKKHDLKAIIEAFLASDKETIKTLAAWLNRNNDSPLTQTLSSLLNAALEEPVNVPKFLEALNLKNRSAKAEFELLHKKEQFAPKRDALSEQVLQKFETLQETSGPTYGKLDEIRLSIFNDLFADSQRTHIQKVICKFRTDCCKHFQEADQILGPGGLFTIVEEAVKEIISLYKEIGMEQLDINQVTHQEIIDFKSEKETLQAHVSRLLIPLEGVALKTKAANDAYRDLKGIHEDFFENLSPYLSPIGLKKEIDLFRTKCAKHIKVTNQVMGHGWLYRIAEATIKAVIGLFVGIGMVLGTVFNQGLAKKEHRTAYKDTFLTWHKTDANREMERFKQTLLGNDSNDRGLLDEEKFKPKPK